MTFEQRATWVLALSLLACGGTDAVTVADASVPDGSSPSDAGTTSDGGALTDAGGTLGCVDPPGTVVAAPVMEKRTVENATARNAICNDGTPAVYYIRRGSGCGAKRWVLGLEGGGSCNTLAECAARGPGLRGTSGAAASKNGTGILSADAAANPDFFTANAVYVEYCSSDNWAGHRAASADTGNFAFYGKDIVAAVVEDLAMTDAKEVLLVGSSAGGLGVLANADALQARMPQARVRAVDDARWVADILAFAPAGGSGLPSYTEFDARFAYWSAQVDASCAAAETTHLGKCSIGNTIFPQLTVPLFVHQDQRDPIQLKMLGLEAATNQAERNAYLSTFRTAITSSLGPVTGVFSPRAGDHGLVFSPDFNVRALQGTTYREALGNWYFERQGPKKLVE
ncbi:MAG: hypothetical protein HOO96_04110 [Polyangiaceae bacterium]|nr:hypothetical protein [Polyangiaceae bacterium]